MPPRPALSSLGWRCAVRTGIPFRCRPFATRARRPPPPPPFGTVETCPEPTCGCAAMPAMPDGLPLDREGPMKGAIAGYAEQVLVCTGNTDWPSRIEEESSGDNLAADLKELFGRGGDYSDPFHNISVLNASFPSSIPPRPEVQSTSAYLLPSFKYVPFLPRVSFDSVQALAKGFLLPAKLHAAHDGLSPIHRDRLTRKDAYQGLLLGVQDVHDVLVLICGHGGRDARCGIVAPVLKAEFDEKLRGEGFDVLRGAVQVGLRDAPRIPGEVGAEKTAARIGTISHIGGHKFAGNVIIYLPPSLKMGDKAHPLAGHGIWYGRVEPKHVEGIVRETILKGNVVADMFRGGIDAERNMLRMTVTVVHDLISAIDLDDVMMRPGTRLFAASLGRQTLQRSGDLVCLGQPRRRVNIPPGSSCEVSASRGLASRPASTQHRSSKRRPTLPAPIEARIFPPVVLLGLLLVGGAGYYLSAAPARPDTLNDRFFVPYTVAAREAISPTSFVITVVPHTPNPAHPYLVAATDDDAAAAPARWRHALWSVEFKQPEVQISRHYTPLPPRRGEDPAADGALRFYVRAVAAGEMSHYLARRRVGQDVHLRGPHVGFELVERLGGSGGRVVFLARGTGVVPGMQAAKAVLDADRGARVDLLWAVRGREEVQRAAASPSASRWFWQEQRPTELGLEIQDPSPVARHLGDMKASYGDRLRIQVAVDAEGSKFQDKDIKNALAAAPAVAPFQPGCRLHDQAMHIGATEFSTPEAPGCLCPSSEGSVPGKNLVIVSGPDGFIEHYAGPKIWQGGFQTQGPVGGVIGALQRQEPQLARDWLLLKM
ncbi:hypothetical protein AK830_g5298 [Neonectria ditissima]|uniref:Altered inheritance of mitochondria protein 32 n=1 Tax=Neonectria ditissima TaxID=78410 RepID=A0A0P7BJA3_9HYPO|nr:hypothetical protein AK830_g5298 [Neonectria ditissima]